MDGLLNINGRIIGDGQPAYIIAEIGLNHNGSLNLAKQLVKKAKECGADAVKFQKRDLKFLYKQDIYKDPNKDSQSTAYLIDVFKKFNLKENEFAEIKKFCDRLGITFICTPFDIKSLMFLGELNVPAYKIASCDLTNTFLMHRIIKKNKPILLSTGMSRISEIDLAVSFLKKNKTKFALLHCVSNYPVAFKDVNLKMIETLRKRYKIPVGYSGHERGITVAVCSVAIGARIVEKHFTLDRSMEGPDHNISLTPEGLLKMVNRIRVIEEAIGDGKKIITRGEILNREVFAKSMIARKNIKKGQIISYDQIEIKAPGKGLSPQKIDLVVGTKATRDISKNDYFTEQDLLGIE